MTTGSDDWRWDIAKMRQNPNLHTNEFEITAETFPIIAEICKNLSQAVSALNAEGQTFNLTDLAQAMSPSKVPKEVRKAFKDIESAQVLLLSDKQQLDRFQDRLDQQNESEQRLRALAYLWDDKLPKTTYWTGKKESIDFGILADRASEGLDEIGELLTKMIQGDQNDKEKFEKIMSEVYDRTRLEYTDFDPSTYRHIPRPKSDRKKRTFKNVKLFLMNKTLT